MQTINLHIHEKTIIPVLYAKQGDVGRKFQVVIADGIPDGVTFSAWYSGAGGEGNYTDIGDRSAFAVEGNTITVELITQMLINAGRGALCLVMSGADGSQLATWNIPYEVEPVPGMGSAAAEQYYTALSESASLAVDAANRAEEAASSFKVDKSLSIPGKPADSKSTGDAISAVVLSATEKDGVVTLSLGGNVPGGGGGGTAVSPTIDVTKIDGGHKVTVTDVDGSQDFNVMDGKDGDPGYTPKKGVDYYTEADKQEMVAAVLAAMPTWEGGSY